MKKIKDKKIYPLAKPYIGKDEEKLVLEVLRSGVLSMGGKTDIFEKEFAQFADTKYACAVSSGTAGLHMALIAAGIGPGDEVITTPFSFIASANSILYVGARPVFVEIDPLTYNIDANKIEAAITAKTKAILPVHIFGQAADMDLIMKLARKYKLKVIEDACESLGATRNGKKVGTFGDMAVVAFYPNKQMTTGEGGMVITNSKEYYEMCVSLRNQGRPYSSSFWHSKGGSWLTHARLGYNYRMDEMSAAVGIAQIRKIKFLIDERIKIANLYSKALKGLENILQIPMVGENNMHTWFLYVVLIKAGKIKRDQLIARLGERGISTKPYLPSIHLAQFYKKLYGFKLGDFEISESVSNTALALPIYIGLTEKDIKYICEQLVLLI